jgi:hypothetical protein
VWESIKYVRKRRKKTKRGRQPYSSSDIAVLFTAQGMVQKRGFLRFYGEEYQKRMPMEAMRACCASFPKARNWDELCDAVVEKYDELIATVKKKIEEDADEDLARPKARVLQALAGDTAGYVDGMSRTDRTVLDKADPGSALWNYTLRGFVDRAIGDQFPARGRTVREMTWRSDGSGSVRFEDGKWKLHLHKTMFKNWRSELFKDVEWVDVVLEDLYGLYERVWEYLKPGGARDQILDGRESDSFLVKDSDTPELKPRDFGRIVELDTMVLNAVMDDPQFEKMRNFGPHARRNNSSSAPRVRQRPPACFSSASGLPARTTVSRTRRSTLP